MIGVFLTNKEGKLCFAQPPQDAVPDIAAIHYHAAKFKVSIILKNGEERMLATEIASDLRDAFSTEAKVLVVDFTDQGEFNLEYKVPLTVV